MLLFQRLTKPSSFSLKHLKQNNIADIKFLFQHVNKKGFFLKPAENQMHHPAMGFKIFFY
jgi:hypothetical protein